MKKINIQPYANNIFGLLSSYQQYRGRICLQLTYLLSLRRCSISAKQSGWSGRVRHVCAGGATELHLLMFIAEQWTLNTSVWRLIKVEVQFIRISVSYSGTAAGLPRVHGRIYCLAGSYCWEMINVYVKFCVENAHSSNCRNETLIKPWQQECGSQEKPDG